MAQLKDSRKEDNNLVFSGVHHMKTSRSAYLSALPDLCALFLLLHSPDQIKLVVYTCNYVNPVHDEKQ